MTQIVKIEQWSASFIVMKHNYVFRQNIRFRIRRVKADSNWVKGIVVCDVSKIQIQCWLMLNDGKHEVIFAIVPCERALRSKQPFICGSATECKHQ